MIRILAVTDGHSHFEEAIHEYARRTEKTLKVVTIKNERSTDPKLVVRKETEKIIEILWKAPGYCILLDERWESMTTLNFEKNMRKLLDRSENITFIIGGAFGVDREKLSTSIQSILKLSDFVVPHSLALLILLEQLYRIHEIWRGSKYHHS